MKYAVVWHDEYWGTVQIETAEIPEPRTSLEIWYLVRGDDVHEPQEVYEDYVEDWDAYGSHHKGMITRIWLGDDSHQAARKLYDELLATGVKADD